MFEVNVSFSEDFLCEFVRVIDDSNIIYQGFVEKVEDKTLHLSGNREHKVHIHILYDKKLQLFPADSPEKVEEYWLDTGTTGFRHQTKEIDCPKSKDYFDELQSGGFVTKY